MALDYAAGDLFSVPRPAEPADIDALVECSRRLAFETEKRVLDTSRVRRGYELRFQLTLPVPPALVISVSEKVVAAIVLGGIEVSEWSGGIWLIVTSLYVYPEYQKSGLGNALYRASRQLAQLVPGVIGLRLYIDDRNKMALGFYKAAGMVPDEHYLILNDTWEHAFRPAQVLGRGKRTATAEPQSQP